MTQALRIVWKRTAKKISLQMTAEAFSEINYCKLCTICMKNPKFVATSTSVNLVMKFILVIV